MKNLGGRRNHSKRFVLFAHFVVLAVVGFLLTSHGI
jgi:hypothetical protein